MTATQTQAAPGLSGEEVARFHREGFLSVDHFCTPEDLAVVRELLDGLFARFDELPKTLAFDLGDVKLHDGVQRVPQINSNVQFDPRLRDTAVFRNAERIARQLCGEGVTYNGDHAIYKPPHSRREVPWHQDLAYAHDPDAICFNANFWVPLQEATLENGCMQFIPHSHWGNLLQHHPVGHDPKVHTLECDPIDASAAVVCPLRPGGCTIQHGKTLHYTGPNITDQMRRAWILNFGFHVTPTWRGNGK
ncbi:MAG: phytanoyl-CoA dioxygenase family protein [Planctomycetes bacterium]|nr:phytanoyl-CoA dioxygenase family protein [Planctomycetota bacterium]